MKENNYWQEYYNHHKEYLSLPPTYESTIKFFDSVIHYINIQEATSSMISEKNKVFLKCNPEKIIEHLNKLTKEDFQKFLSEDNHFFNFIYLFIKEAYSGIYLKKTNDYSDEGCLISENMDFLIKKDGSILNPYICFLKCIELLKNKNVDNPYEKILNLLGEGIRDISIEKNLSNKITVKLKSNRFYDEFENYFLDFLKKQENNKEFLNWCRTPKNKNIISTRVKYLNDEKIKCFLYLLAKSDYSKIAEKTNKKEDFFDFINSIEFDKEPLNAIDNNDFFIEIIETISEITNNIPKKELIEFLKTKIKNPNHINSFKNFLNTDFQLLNFTFSLLILNKLIDEKQTNIEDFEFALKNIISSIGIKKGEAGETESLKIFNSKILSVDYVLNNIFSNNKEYVNKYIELLDEKILTLLKKENFNEELFLLPFYSKKINLCTKEQLKSIIYFIDNQREKVDSFLSSISNKQIKQKTNDNLQEPYYNNTDKIKLQIEIILANKENNENFTKKENKVLRF